MPSYSEERKQQILNKLLPPSNMTVEAVALEVWQFRVQLQQDLEQLYQSLESANGQPLVFPSYDKFSWQE